ncbi:hypothetical protein NL676_004427 [Syzygium grande]|nr:hypothetical protein NL676_004427 [Syzygium grande]
MGVRPILTPLSHSSAVYSHRPQRLPRSTVDADQFTLLAINSRQTVATPRRPQAFAAASSSSHCFSRTDAANRRASLLRSHAPDVVQQALLPNAGDFLTSTSRSNAELLAATRDVGGLLVSSSKASSNIASVGTSASSPRA